MRRSSVDSRMRRILEVGAIGVLMALLAAPAGVPGARVVQGAVARSGSGTGEAQVVFSCPTGTTTIASGASADPRDVPDGGTVALTLTLAIPGSPVVDTGGDLWVSFPLPAAVAAVNAVGFTDARGLAATAWFADGGALTLILTPDHERAEMAATALASFQLRSGVAPTSVAVAAPDRLTIAPASHDGTDPQVCTPDGSPATLVSFSVVEAPVPPPGDPGDDPPDGSTTTTTTTTTTPTTTTPTPTTTTPIAPPDPAGGGDAPSPPPLTAQEIPTLPPSPDPASASRVVTADADGAAARLDDASELLAASTERLEALRRRSQRLGAAERDLEAERSRLSARIDRARLDLARRATDAYIAAVDAHLSIGSTSSEAALMSVVLEDGVAAYDRLLDRQADVVRELSDVASTRARRQDSIDGAVADRRDLQSQVSDGRYQMATFRGGGRLAVSGFQFVVGGDHSFTDSWHAPRSGGRQHQGTDIFAAEGTPLYAAERGALARVGTDNLGGTKLWLVGESGTHYYYAHLSRYAAGVADGVVVQAGQVIGYVGHTGNARTTPPHLHFEVHPGGGDAVNSYPMLVAADAGTTAAAPAPTPSPAPTPTPGPDEPSPEEPAVTTTTEAPASTGTTVAADPSPDPGPSTGERPVFVRSWGARGSAEGEFADPRGVAVAEDGSVYVADAGNDRIQRFEADGTFVDEWGGTGSDEGQFHHATGVAVGPSGNVYVADTQNNRIQKFSAEGRFLTAWGTTGGREGRFNEPSGVAVDGAGHVYVADTLNNRVQEFDSAGEFVDSWGGFGADDGRFANPYGVAVDAAGDVYVADTFNGRVQRFTGSGRFVTAWGDQAAPGEALHRPRGVAVDGDGEVWVVDRAGRSIRQYDSNGAFLRAWGRRGSGDARLTRPSGLAVDGSGRLYVVDTGNARAQEFAPPTLPPAS